MIGLLCCLPIGEYIPWSTKFSDLDVSYHDVIRVTYLSSAGACCKGFIIAKTNVVGPIVPTVLMASKLLGAKDAAIRGSTVVAGGSALKDAAISGKRLAAGTAKI